MSTKQDLLGLIQNLRAMLDRKEKESVEAHKEINWAHDYHWRKLSRMDGLVKAMQLTDAALASESGKAHADRMQKLEEIVKLLRMCLEDDPNSYQWRDSHLDLGDAMRDLDGGAIARRALEDKNDD